MARFRRFPITNVVATYAVLIDTAGEVNEVLSVAGGAVASDGGEGQFVWSAGVGVTNGGTIFSGPAGSGGYWSRLRPNDDVYLEWFGGKADGILSDTADGFGGYTTDGSPDVGLSNHLFTDADIGKIVRVDGCGAAGIALVGYIVSIPVQNGPYCTIDKNASLTQSATKIMFVGSDNSDAMDSCLTLAGSTTGQAARIKLRRGTYCFSRKIAVTAVMSASIVGARGDIRNQFTRIAVCHENEGLHIYQSATDKARGHFSGFEIWSHATALGCLRNARTNATISHFRTEFGLYGLHVDNSFSSHYSNFYCRRATSHGIYLDGLTNFCNHNDFHFFQSDSNGGSGVYATHGAINSFVGECNNNALFPFHFNQQQSTRFAGYCETTDAAATYQLGKIEDNCVDCSDEGLWAGALRATVDNGMGSKTRDSQGVSGSKATYAAGKITNLQSDSEFLGGVGGFAYGGTLGGVITAGLATVTSDATVGFLSGHSLRIQTDAAVTGTPTAVVYATRGFGHTLLIGETVIVRGWVRASRPMFYNNDASQAYFQINVTTDGLPIGDNVHTPYADDTCWRPFIAAFRMSSSATGPCIFNLQVANARGTGGTPDTVWVTGLELFVLPATAAATAAAERGKDWAKMPYVRTFKTSTQTANIGAFAQAPIVLTADIPAAGAHMDGTMLIEDTGIGLNLVVYGNGGRVAMTGVAF